MKVWKRVLLKTVVFLLIMAAAACAAIGWRGTQQSTSDYAINRYLDLLIGNDVEKAYKLLDQSEEEQMNQEEYASALSAKKYSIYASYNVSELNNRRDSNGNEYVDFHAEFLNADGEVQLEEDFTVKKQSEPLMGIFDVWKVMSSHCMIKNFLLTVPAGSEVYLNSQALDASWRIQGDAAAAQDSYQIPSLLPVKQTLVIRHSILESVNTTLDPTEGSADYTGSMPLKQAAQDACKEYGVNMLKELYACSATGKPKNLNEELFGDCYKDAKKFVRSQTKTFNSDTAVFKNAAISDFAAQFGDLVYTEDETGALTVEMTFSYHYVVREDVTVDTEEYNEDGTAVQDTSTSSHSGDNTAIFTMAFYDDTWHVAAMEVPEI